MKIKALRSFCGRISMAEGEIRECNNEYVVNDLLKAGYVEAVVPPPSEEKDKKTTRRKKAVVSGEDQ